MAAVRALDLDILAALQRIASSSMGGCAHQAEGHDHLGREAVRAVRSRRRQSPPSHFLLSSPLVCYSCDPSWISGASACLVI